jgi:hypothetical protein
MTTTIATDQVWRSKAGDGRESWIVDSVAEDGTICLRSGSKRIYLSDDELVRDWERVK